MTRSKSGKKKNKSKASMSGQDYVELPASAASYDGPIDTPSMREQLDLHTFPLRICNVIASSAGGVLATVFDAAAQAGTANAWAELSAIFEEYRILAFRVHLLPINKYATGTTNFPMLSVIDRRNSTALSSLGEAASYASAKEHIIGNTITRVARMEGFDESSWTLTTTTVPAAANMYVKLYGSGLAASTNYYQYLNTVVVQFRGLRNT